MQTTDIGLLMLMVAVWQADWLTLCDGCSAASGLVSGKACSSVTTAARCVTRGAKTMCRCRAWRSSTHPTATPRYVSGGGDPPNPAYNQKASYTDTASFSE